MREASLLRPARPDFLLYSPLLLLSIIIVVCSPGWALALYFQFPTHLLTFLAYFHFLIVGWKPRKPPEPPGNPFIMHLETLHRYVNVSVPCGPLAGRRGTSHGSSKAFSVKRNTMTLSFLPSPQHDLRTK